MRRAWWGGVAAGVLLVAGCDWTGYGYDASHGHANPGEREIGVGNVADLELQWTRSTGRNVDFRSPPALSDGVMVVASFLLRDDRETYDGRLQAVDVATGAPLWDHTLPLTPVRAPTIVDGVVFVGTGYWQEGSRSLVQAYDLRTGQRRWEVPVEEPVYQPVTVSDGRVYAVGSPVQSGAASHLRVLDAATGAELWRKDLPLAFEVVPTVADGLVVVAAPEVQAFDAATGALVWTADSRPTETLPYAFGRFYATDPDGLEALDAATGQVVWRAAWDPTLVPVGAPAISGTTIFAQETNLRFGPQAVVAFDAHTGARRWSRQLPTGQLSAANGVLYLTTRTTLFALDAGTGEPITQWPVRLPSEAVVAHGHLYLHDSAFPEETFLRAYGLPTP